MSFRNPFFSSLATMWAVRPRAILRPMTLLGVTLATCLAASAATAASHWVVTWGASPAPQLATEEEMQTSHLVYQDQTLREIVHTSIGGDTVRVRLSNAYGKQAVEIGAAHIAVRGKGSEIVGGKGQALTFGGRTSVRIPANALVLSDPVKMAVPASGDLAISLYLPKPTVGGGIHYAASQTSYIAKGNVVSAATLSDATAITSWVFLTGVEVTAPATAATLVAFGDSITDGARSTTDTNHRWPNFLAERLLARKTGAKIGVLDAGIGGNRILNDPASNIRFGMSALSRFDRDVLAQPGVKYVILLEGINDLGHYGPDSPEGEKVSAEDIIAGMKQLIERAHSRGIKIFGGTLTPFEGTPFPGYFSADKEVKRKAVNAWIRTSKAFDGVVDFDKAIQDPQHPDQMLEIYNGGDHLHPGDAGYKKMGEAVDLALIQ